MIVAETGIWFSPTGALIIALISFIVGVFSGLEATRPQWPNDRRC